MAEVGSTCAMSVNWWGAGNPADAVDDFLRTEAGSCYRILEWRPAKAGSKTLGRFIVERLGQDAVQFGEPGVIEWIWSPRRRRPGR